MFGRAKPPTSSPAPANAPGEPIIAALLIESDSLDLRAVAGKLKGLKPGGITPADAAIKEGILSFRLGDDFLAIAPMPAPYPWSDLEGPCQTSWMWPDHTPAMSVRRHRSHALVTAVGGSGGRIERRLALTQVTGRAAEVPGVLGVYWPEATLVHHPPMFAEMAREITTPEAPPLYLWVDFRVFRNPDGSSGMFTTGLLPLGQMEVEIPRIDMPPKDLHDWSVNIAYYLLDKGPAVKDGDTIGMSATQQIRIRHRPSMFGKRGKVMQLQA